MSVDKSGFVDEHRHNFLPDWAFLSYLFFASADAGGLPSAKFFVFMFRLLFIFQVQITFHHAVTPAQPQPCTPFFPAGFG